MLIASAAALSSIARVLLGLLTSSAANSANADLTSASGANALLEKLQKGEVIEKGSALGEEDFEKQRLLKVREVIDSIDLNSITPLKALNILDKLKKL